VAAISDQSEERFENFRRKRNQPPFAKQLMLGWIDPERPELVELFGLPAHGRLFQRFFSDFSVFPNDACNSHSLGFRPRGNSQGGSRHREFFQVMRILVQRDGWRKYFRG
jgi:hypothetical protein